uniref:Uncharacterized protein n=1 Tax=Metapenaeus joyneri majanivirus TaxID=2984280 RepID=A0A9C7F870_9VIRU|nr:MAG: hypothetical protein [Metapenaeus joyneri majanivirus]
MGEISKNITLYPSNVNLIGNEHNTLFITNKPNNEYYSKEEPHDEKLYKFVSEETIQNGNKNKIVSEEIIQNGKIHKIVSEEITQNGKTHRNVKEIKGYLNFSDNKNLIQQKNNNYKTIIKDNEFHNNKIKKLPVVRHDDNKDTKLSIVEYNNNNNDKKHKRVSVIKNTSAVKYAVNDTKKGRSRSYVTTMYKYYKKIA